MSSCAFVPLRAPSWMKFLFRLSLYFFSVPSVVSVVRTESSGSTVDRPRRMTASGVQSPTFSASNSGIARTIRSAVSTAARPSSTVTSGRPPALHGGDEASSSARSGSTSSICNSSTLTRSAKFSSDRSCDLARADLRHRVADGVEVAAAAGDDAVPLLVVQRHVRVAAEDAQPPLGLQRQPRLAVTLATQPFSNVRRALQMSSTSPMTLTPMASILRHLGLRPAAARCRCRGSSCPARRRRRCCGRSSG